MDSKLKEESSQPLIEDEETSLQWAKKPSRLGRLTWTTSLLVLITTNIATLILGLFVYRQLLPQTSCNSIHKDPWFGDIPSKEVLWEVDDRFVDTNPKVFYNQTDGDDYSIWSEIYPSGWVALKGKPDQELIGGALLSEWGSESEEWEDGTQAWAVTLMHQIHCLGTLKSAFHLLQEGQELDHERSGHIPHCIEYFRQSFMCQADLTLEPPMDAHHWPQGTSGWGNVHQCRDWDAVLQALKDRAILREGGRWIRYRPE